MHPTLGHNSRKSKTYAPCSSFISPLPDSLVIAPLKGQKKYPIFWSNVAQVKAALQIPHPSFEEARRHAWECFVQPAFQLLNPSSTIR